MRNLPPLLAADLQRSVSTLCCLLKVTPARAPVFGITSLDRDLAYDDGSGSLAYVARSGYTPMDTQTRADMGVNNSEAHGLLAKYPAQGVTLDGIRRGDYDNARFVQYLVNYAAPAHGHVILSAGKVGQARTLDDLTCRLELRSLEDILKQNSLIELTSITCRARFGDARCKVTQRWYDSTVATVGAEADRTCTLAFAPGTQSPPGGTTGNVQAVPFFQGNGSTTAAQLKDTAGQAVKSGFTVSAVKLNGTALAGGAYSVSAAGIVTLATAPASGAQATWDGTVTLQPDGYFVPGVVQWVSGANAGRENETESYSAATGALTLAIPARADIQPGDTLRIRIDCAYSKAFCKDVHNNLLNFRGEPELPRGNGTDLMAPTPRQA